MIAEYTVSKDVGSGAIYLADHKGGKPFLAESYWAIMSIVDK